MIGSGVLLLGLYILLRSESSSGRRWILIGIRGKADQYIEQKLFRSDNARHYLHGASLRLFFHYLLHQVLSGTLFIVRFLERGLHRLRRQNKQIAKSVKSEKAETHLHRIAEHKEAVALSEEEKDVLRHRSLNDEI